MPKLVRIVAVVILAIAVNLVLFAAAVQMGDVSEEPDLRDIAAIRLVQIEPPKHMEPPKPKEETEQAKTVQRTNQPHTVTNRPQVNVNLPKLNIDVNPRITSGFALDPSLIGEDIQTPPTTFSGVFGLDEVDQAPSVLRGVQPEYPYSAKRKGQTGVVEVKALVGADGNVQSVSVVKADPKGVFEDAVLIAVRKWKFKPGIKDGQNVPTWVVFPVRFELNK